MHGLISTYGVEEFINIAKSKPLKFLEGTFKPNPEYAFWTRIKELDLYVNF